MTHSLFHKIWTPHAVIARQHGPSLLYIDRHIVHEGSFHAFNQLRTRNLSLRQPAQVFGVPDHYVPTTGRRAKDAATAEIGKMITQFDHNMIWGGIPHFPLSDQRQGIVHVVGPEQGITLPGMTLVCSDSHTSTHGALGAIAFGIGQSESMHVMATQTLWQIKPRVMRIRVDGTLGLGVSAKDIILAIIAKIGAAGAVGYAIEYAGSAIMALDMDGRLTVCNMSIEAGARAGLVAPDETTFNYLRGREFAPSGAKFDEAIADWQTLRTDDGAVFDKEVTIDASKLSPHVTWGTNPAQVVALDGRVPTPSDYSDATERDSVTRALEYMGLQAGTAIRDIKVDTVFIGSCTNSRIEDLRAVANVVRGRKVSVKRVMVVPGSHAVKLQAQAEGLDKIFIDAGIDWREPGCSMCLAMNPDKLAPQERAASTSNRNFEGRQGRGGRTHLVSPAVAAATAVAGHFASPEDLK